MRIGFSCYSTPRPSAIRLGGDTSRRSTPYSSGQRRILHSSCCGPSSPLARGVDAKRTGCRKFPSGGGVPEGRGGLWFAIIVALFIATQSFATPTATDRKTVSSKAYVDTNVELKQPKIPAANPNNTTVGVSVVTYTGNEGVIGERQIYDGTNAYTNGDANKLVTASALNGSVTNLPTMETSKLTCANPGTCSLWTIVDQQVYGQNSNNNNNNSNSGSGTN